MKPGTIRLRKTSDVNQEAVIYEVVDEERAVLLDITRTDAGVFEACIMDNQGQGRVIDLSTLLELIQEAKRRIEAEE